MLALPFCGEFLFHNPCRLLFLIWGDSLTDPVLASFLPGKFVFDIPRWLHFYAGCFSSTSHADFVFMWGVSLIHPVLASFLSGSFFYTSHSGFFFLFRFFICGVSLTRPVLVSFFYQGSFSYTSRAGFIFIWGVSLTHPVLASFLSGELLLHIPCWL